MLDMDDKGSIPFMTRHDIEWVTEWAADYVCHPVQDDDDLGQRLDYLLASVRLKIVDCFANGTDAPTELLAAQGVSSDAYDYLPTRLTKARALDRLAAEMSSEAPNLREGDE